MAQKSRDLAKHYLLKLRHKVGAVRVGVSRPISAAAKGATLPDPS